MPKYDLYAEVGEKEVKFEITYDIGYNGIGQYECHGVKGFDKGEVELDITDVKFDKTNLTAAEIDEINDFIEENRENWVDEILMDQPEKDDGADEKLDRMRDAA